jgi:hypothetical protein
LTRRPAQGTRHQVLFGGDVVSGDEVVIKLERVAGALETETLCADVADSPRLAGSAPAISREDPSGRWRFGTVLDQRFRRCGPVPVAAPLVSHGDPAPGNFLADDGRVRDALVARPLAAIRFAHRRCERNRHSGVLPPRDAIETLAAALRTVDWIAT